MKKNSPKQISPQGKVKSTDAVATTKRMPPPPPSRKDTQGK
jgi:hypothetical protein